MRHLVVLLVATLALGACKKPRPEVDRTPNVPAAAPSDDGDRSGGVPEEVPAEAEEAADAAE